jgi:hypothetical protein
MSTQELTHKVQMADGRTMFFKEDVALAYLRKLESGAYDGSIESVKKLTPTELATLAKAKEITNPDSRAKAKDDK